MESMFAYDTIIGNLVIIGKEDKITHIYFNHQEVPKDIEVKETPIIKEAAKQLDEYFSGKRKNFDLKLEPKGTDFQKSVWNELLKIPYGETKSYGEIAKNINNPKAARAVGLANNRNPISIIIPCHRVIGANGKLVGYGGGLNIKEKLLELEKTNL